jgi:hypothetical protein
MNRILVTFIFLLAAFALAAQDGPELMNRTTIKYDLLGSATQNSSGIELDKAGGESLDGDNCAIQFHILNAEGLSVDIDVNVDVIGNPNHGSMRAAWVSTGSNESIQLQSLYGQGFHRLSTVPDVPVLRLYLMDDCDSNLMNTIDVFVKGVTLTIDGNPYTVNF